MKRFCKELFWFLITLTVVVYALQFLFSARIKNKCINEHDNLHITNNVNADIVIMGSSRCWAHFDPSFFKSAYDLKAVNIGVEGHSELSMINVRLREYLSRNSNPRYAILSFDPLIRMGSISENVNFRNKNAFARYAFLPKKIDTPILNYFKFTFLEKYVPLYAAFKYKVFFRGILSGGYSKYVKYGHAISAATWDTVKRPVNLELRRNFITPRSIDSVQLGIRALNQFCKDKGIKLICIQTPVYRTFKYDSAFQYTKIICDNLGIPFIDVNNTAIGEDYRNFTNSYHLNRVGVDKMNAILAKDSTLNSILFH